MNLKNLFSALALILSAIFSQASAQKVEQYQGSGDIVSLIANGHVAITASAIPGDSVKLTISDRFTDVSWMEEGRKALDRQVIFLGNELQTTKDSVCTIGKRIKGYDTQISKLKKKKGQSARTARAAYGALRSIEKVRLALYQNELKRKKSDLATAKKAVKPYRKAIVASKMNQPSSQKG